jgi:hypothetical protein
MPLKALTLRARQISPLHSKNPFTFKSQSTLPCGLKTVVAGIFALALKPELKFSSFPNSPFFADIQIFPERMLFDTIVEGGVLLGKSSHFVIIQREKVRLWRPKAREKGEGKPSTFISSVVEREMASGNEALIYAIFDNEEVAIEVSNALRSNPIISIGKSESIFQILADNVHPCNVIEGPIPISETPVSAHHWENVKNTPLQLYPLLTIANDKYVVNFFITPYENIRIEKDFTLLQYKPIAFLHPVDGYIIENSKEIKYVAKLSSK